VKKKQPTWREGTVWDNLAAAADMLGFQNADIALGLAYVPWDSTQDRDAFLAALVAPRVSDIYREGGPVG
jgi:hypothetical protein